jgi:hypothetical protein
MNTIRITIRPREPIRGGSIVEISNLRDMLTPSNGSLSVSSQIVNEADGERTGRGQIPLGSTSSLNPNYPDPPLEDTGAWDAMHSRIRIFVRIDQIIPSDADTVIVFTLQNPASKRRTGPLVPRARVFRYDSEGVFNIIADSPVVPHADYRMILGVGGGALPHFKTAVIKQSSDVQGNLNTITLALTPTSDVGSGSIVSIVDLTGAGVFNPITRDNPMPITVGRCNDWTRKSEEECSGVFKYSFIESTPQDDGNVVEITSEKILNRKWTDLKAIFGPSAEWDYETGVLKMTVAQ